VNARMAFEEVALIMFIVGSLAIYCWVVVDVATRPSCEERGLVELDDGYALVGKVLVRQTKCVQP
jgi:hypothetical protein